VGYETKVRNRENTDRDRDISTDIGWRKGCKEIMIIQINNKRAPGLAAALSDES